MIASESGIFSIVPCVVVVSVLQCGNGGAVCSPPPPPLTQRRETCAALQSQPVMYVRLTGYMEAVYSVLIMAFS